MNKKLNKLLQPQELPINEERKTQLIELGKKQLNLQQRNTFSFWHLFKTTLNFIGLKFWLLQLLILAIMIFYLDAMTLALANWFGPDISYPMTNATISMLTLLFLFSNILIVGNLIKPFLAGMADLEQTLKYNLRLHLIMKLIIFGLYDILLAVGIALFSNIFLSMLFWQIILFLLVPLNVFALLTLTLVTLGKRKLSTLVKCLIVGLGIGFFQIIALRTDIYQQPLLFWSMAYLLSSGILGLGLYQSFRKKNWGQI